MELKGKKILLTGGTGSFGQKCCQILIEEYQPKELVIFSRDESKQFDMMRKFQVPNIRFVIGDIRDRQRLLEACHGIDVIIHAAALKQVPQAEYNPFEYVKTNVIGTENVIEVARECGVRRIIATSTDKAVHPLNHYGATKLCADKLFVSANYYVNGSDIRFACVRMGNLIGSRGSVIPIFREMSKTGRVTITDKRMTRFWLTLDSAVRFVLNRLQDMQGGEIFVPDSPTMSLVDLVKAIAPGVEIEYIGIRPGEKIDEILISRHESSQAVRFPEGFFAVLPNYLDLDDYISGTGSAKLPEGYEYDSTDPHNTLSIEKMRDILDNEDI